MPNDVKLRLPEVVVPGRRLGRNLNHDVRSARYLVMPRGVARTKMWDRILPILDQGELGACTGYATVGALGTMGLFEHLTRDQQQLLGDAEAVKLYSLATHLDPFDGEFEPVDSGSDGLSVAKAAKAEGMISGYRHITSIAAAQTAILDAPFIVGTMWYSGMDDTDGAGLVHATGVERGGHEYQCFGYDAPSDTWHFCNSWGSGWGDHGRFHMTGPDFAKLLAAQGDATTLVPVTQPAPQPAPAPTPPADGWATFPLGEYLSFKAHPYSVPKRRAFTTATDLWIARRGQGTE